MPKIPLEIRDVIEKPGETWSEKEKKQGFAFSFQEQKGDFFLGLSPRNHKIISWSLTNKPVYAKIRLSQTLLKEVKMKKGRNLQEADQCYKYTGWPAHELSNHLQKLAKIARRLKEAFPNYFFDPPKKTEWGLFGKIGWGWATIFVGENGVGQIGKLVFRCQNEKIIFDHGKAYGKGRYPSSEKAIKEMSRWLDENLES